MSKRAVLSVYDKTGICDLARELVAMGWELVASGGTSRMLHKVGLPVVEVAELTGAPEMLGGRVKTLHPVIHGGILARNMAEDLADLQAQDIDMIDLVVCNLYPFEETISQPDVTMEMAVEQIDIGGVTLLRAAAKNFARVLVVCDPDDYGDVIDALRGDSAGLPLRRRLAAKAFAQTRDYDTAITAYLTGVERTLTSKETDSDFAQ
jgi:phosphoribosylaminoimidazolecarboxamide formyltransferase/IMP cyclohydrolase